MTRLFSSLKNFFHPLQTSQHQPTLTFDYDKNTALGSMMDSMQKLGNILTGTVSVSEEQHRRNTELIELARLEQERESTNNALKAQHRLMITTLITAGVALLSSGSAIFVTLYRKPAAGPVVNVRPVQPEVKVYVPPQNTTTNMTPQN